VGQDGAPTLSGPRDEQVDVAKISDILAGGRSISFEFFPPRTPEAEEQLERTLVELESLHPSYVSVTYGAGGTTRERTHDLVVHINHDTSMTAMAHLTCAAHSRAELDDIVTRYRDSSIENILALGGDPPKDLDLPPGELEHAIDLVRLARGIGDFSIGVAVHPEPHPRSPSVESDRRYTAEKLAEADFGVTQFFFEPHHYFELLDALDQRGVDRPVIPGIMPVLSIAGITRMAELQGSAFPGWLAARLHEVEDDPAAVRAVGIEEATRLCAALLEGGAPGLHFYTLNRSPATRDIAANLGLAPAR
jgi:methylenetetrahydrofolate reductase (NADPH)